MSTPRQGSCRTFQPPRLFQKRGIFRCFFRSPDLHKLLCTRELPLPFFKDRSLLGTTHNRPPATPIPRPSGFLQPAREAHERAAAGQAGELPAAERSGSLSKSIAGRVFRVPAPPESSSGPRKTNTSRPAFPTFELFSTLPPECLNLCADSAIQAADRALRPPPQPLRSALPPAHLRARHVSPTDARYEFARRPHRLSPGAPLPPDVTSPVSSMSTAGLTRPIVPEIPTLWCGNVNWV